MQFNIKNILAVVITVLLFNLPLFSQITLTPGNGYLSQPPGVETYVVKKEGVIDPSLVPTLTNAEKAKAISYVDGFGRSLQSIVVAGSPNGKDIVSFSRYDNFGRQAKQYLPYEATTSNGAYTDVSTTLSNQLSFYNPTTAVAKKIAGDASPFAESNFETSPLQRILNVGGVGDGFQLGQHYKTMSYRNGTAAENIRKWVVAVGGNATGTLTYGDNDLTVSEVVDENNVHASVYKDKFGRLILKRQDAPVSGFYDTYYVYDNLGNIVYIVPPKAIAKMGSGYNTSSTPELVFQFWYDNKNRVVRKKVPGAKEVYIVYDPLDRVVLTQDGNMRSNLGTKWAYVKYDNANRVIIQGIYTDASVQTQSQMQSYVNGLACYQTTSNTYYEIRQAGTSGYSNQCFPTTNTEDRGYSYFDNYDFNFDGSPDYSQLPQGLINEATATNLTHGLATGSKKKILGSGTPGTWLTDISFYDKYYHIIQVRSNNQLDNTVNDHTTNVVTFTGRVTQAKQYKSLSSLTVTVSTRYEYDDMERLTKVKQTNPGAAEITVAKYEYNALGQLVDKKLHSPDDVNYLQSVDMRYNIRGQLTSINNSARTNDAGVTNDETNDVFGMELLYDKTDVSLGNTASYAGMISAVKWSAKTPVNPTPDERSFKYTYDKLYRLTFSTYQAKIGSSWTRDVNGFNENLTYDENGNIISLQRNAVLANTVTAIDNLTYTYKTTDTENQLDNISDGIPTNATGYGYRNYTGSSSAYTYDDNGNLTTDPKKGTIIIYNELNKPRQIKNASNSTQSITYRYDASGVRISKYVYNGSNTVPVKTIEYVGGYVVENGTLNYYGMAEGRVRLDVGFSGTTYKMEYFITDHQGNTRVSFEDNGTNTNTAMVTQENSYYAFGMQMAGGYTPTNPNKKLYNAGSEWQDDIDGLADYYSTFYREYDPVIGRFNGTDPMSESFESLTTYHYSYNNPINFNDPMGDYAAGSAGTPKYYVPGGGNMRDLVDRVMSSYGWGGGDEGSGGGGGSYDEFKAHFAYLGSDEWKDDIRYNETMEKMKKIQAAAIIGNFKGLGLINTIYTGANRAQFEKDILNIAKVQVGAMALAMIETSKVPLEIRDATSYNDSETSTIGNKVITKYAGGVDNKNPLHIINVPGFVVLAHEIFHGLDDRSKNFKETNYLWHFDKNDRMYNQPQLSRDMGYRSKKSVLMITSDPSHAYYELRAVDFENKIRQFHNLPQREYYGQVFLKTYYPQMNFKSNLDK